MAIQECSKRSRGVTSGLQRRSRMQILFQEHSMSIDLEAFQGFSSGFRDAPAAFQDVSKVFQGGSRDFRGVPEGF